MKIDIHTHTRKCKSGDAQTREISSEEFCEIILSTDVKIVAITNHNVFDLMQFREIESRLGNDAQVWPGIELDIKEENSRAHLLVVVSPKNADKFSGAVAELTDGSTPDSFLVPIEKVLETFDLFNPLYIAHYKQKKPNLSEDAIEKLQTVTRQPWCVLKEVTNSISAGIYISHGHSSIYGSDVQDWAKYKESSCDLPDLRLPVDSFEHFCLLLQKDSTTINTALNRKTSEELVLLPFGDSSILKLKVFNDINVVFGPKGTGKSCILRAIAKHYSENGIDTKVYESASDKLDDLFDTKGRGLTINLNDLDINYCTNEIEFLRTAAEVPITSLSNYVAFFSATNTNRNAQKILLKDLEPEESGSAKHDFDDFHGAVNTTSDFLTFLKENEPVKNELTPEEHEEVTRILSKLHGRLDDRQWGHFARWKTIALFNSAIEKFRREVSRKTGTPAKPTGTGFREYALNRVNIEVNAAEIVRNVEVEIPTQCETVGSLGSSKGTLEYWTKFKFQSGEITDGSMSSLTGVKKLTQKQFINRVRQIRDTVYADNLFQRVADFNATEDGDGVKTVHELLIFKRHFVLDGNQYSPSSGEASMVMLQKELGQEKDIYILDEPERSLGNEYINDVIVPLIKQRALAGKKDLYINPRCEHRCEDAAVLFCLSVP